MARSETPVFIGDELSAAGYRLAGAETFSPPREELAAVFARVKREAKSILITAEYAAMLAPKAISEARRESTLVAIVPDARLSAALPDPGLELRRELGVHE